MDDEYVKSSVEKILQKLSRNQRYRLHQCFKKYSSVQEARRNKPTNFNLSQENWDKLCDMWSDPKFQVCDITFDSFLYIYIYIYQDTCH